MHRLIYDDILYVYKLISLNYSNIEIADDIGVNASTIYRLIKNNIQIVPVKKSFRNYPMKNCIHRQICRKSISSCPDECERYIKWICPKLKRFPFMCNFCPDKNHCVKEKHIFDPDKVFKSRQDLLVESRKCITIPNGTFKTFNQWISPLVKNGISIEALYNEYPEEFPVSPSTVRKWINNGYMSIKRLDLRRAVTYKVKKQYSYKRPYGYDPLIKFGHTHRFFLDYIKTDPKASIMELDTVHGLASEKAKLLTMYHRETHFQIGILIDNIMASSVNKVLTELRVLLGSSYSKMFEVILADNGFEFDGLLNNAIDSETGEVFSQVFFTKPYCSGDKGGCERNHEFFRYYIPKGKSIQHLNQEDINMMFSHINSYPRESLNWKSPFDLFKKKFSSDIVTKLGYQKVDVIDINFLSNKL